MSLDLRRPEWSWEDEESSLRLLEVLLKEEFDFSLLVEDSFRLMEMLVDRLRIGCGLVVTSSWFLILAAGLLKQYCGMMIFVSRLASWTLIPESSGNRNSTGV